MLLEYDGRAFAGWARQPDQRTVQAEVERALATILVEDEVPVTVAGRTDRGVHAWGQVCSYEHEAVDPLRLNAVLPPDVAVLECNPAADGFDARGDARSRTYCYRLLNRRARSARLEGTVHWNPRRLDRDALDACAAALAGTHDFTAFTPTETDHVRFEREVFDAHWERDGDLLGLWITADTFMRHMNRVLVGTMIEVALGRRTVEDFIALLRRRAAVRRGHDRAGAGPCARVGRLRRGSEPAAVGVGDGLRPVAHARLGEDAVDVALHRRRAHDEPVGDLLVRQPLRDEDEHLGLARRQAVGQRRRLGLRHRADDVVLHGVVQRRLAAGDGGDRA